MPFYTQMIPVQTQNQPMMMAIQPSFQTKGNSTFSNIVQVPNQMISIPNQTNSYQINTNMGPFQMVPVIQPPQHVLSSSSEEAVICQTFSSIRFSNMKCLAFILRVSIVTSINLTITDKSSKKFMFPETFVILSSSGADSSALPINKYFRWTWNYCCPWCFGTRNNLPMS